MPCKVVCEDEEIQQEYDLNEFRDSDTNLGLTHNNLYDTVGFVAGIGFGAIGLAAAFSPVGIAYFGLSALVSGVFLAGGWEQEENLSAAEKARVREQLLAMQTSSAQGKPQGIDDLIQLNVEQAVKVVNNPRLSAAERQQSVESALNRVDQLVTVKIDQQDGVISLHVNQEVTVDNSELLAQIKRNRERDRKFRAVVKNKLSKIEATEAELRSNLADISQEVTALRKDYEEIKLNVENTQMIVELIFKEIFTVSIEGFEGNDEIILLKSQLDALTAKVDIGEPVDFQKVVAKAKELKAAINDQIKSKQAELEQYSNDLNTINKGFQGALLALGWIAELASIFGADEQEIALIGVMQSLVKIVYGAFSIYSGNVMSGIQMIGDGIISLIKIFKGPKPDPILSAIQQLGKQIMVELTVLTQQVDKLAIRIDYLYALEEKRDLEIAEHMSNLIVTGFSSVLSSLSKLQRNVLTEVIGGNNDIQLVLGKIESDLDELTRFIQSGFCEIYRRDYELTREGWRHYHRLYPYPEYSLPSDTLSSALSSIVYWGIVSSRSDIFHSGAGEQTCQVQQGEVSAEALVLNPVNPNKETLANATQTELETIYNQVIIDLNPAPLRKYVNKLLISASLYGWRGPTHLVNPNVWHDAVEDFIVFINSMPELPFRAFLREQANLLAWAGKEFIVSMLWLKTDYQLFENLFNQYNEVLHLILKEVDSLVKDFFVKYFQDMDFSTVASNLLSTVDDFLKNFKAFQKAIRKTNDICENPYYDYWSTGNNGYVTIENTLQFLEKRGDLRDFMHSLSCCSQYWRMKTGMPLTREEAGRWLYAKVFDKDYVYYNFRESSLNEKIVHRIAGLRLVDQRVQDAIPTSCYSKDRLYADDACTNGESVLMLAIAGFKRGCFSLADSNLQVKPGCVNVRALRKSSYDQALFDPPIQDDVQGYVSDIAQVVKSFYVNLESPADSFYESYYFEGFDSKTLSEKIKQLNRVMETSRGGLFHDFDQRLAPDHASRKSEDYIELINTYYRAVVNPANGLVCYRMSAIAYRSLINGLLDNYDNIRNLRGKLISGTKGLYNEFLPQANLFIDFYPAYINWLDKFSKDSSENTQGKIIFLSDKMARWLDAQFTGDHSDTVAKRMNKMLLQSLQRKSSFLNSLLNRLDSLRLLIINLFSLAFSDELALNPFARKVLLSLLAGRDIRRAFSEFDQSPDKNNHFSEKIKVSLPDVAYARNYLLKRVQSGVELLPQNFQDLVRDNGVSFQEVLSDINFEQLNIRSGYFDIERDFRDFTAFTKTLPDSDINTLTLTTRKIYEAYRENDREVIKFIKDAQIDLDRLDFDSMSALLLAASFCDLTTIERLVNDYASIAMESNRRQTIFNFFDETCPAHVDLTAIKVFLCATMQAQISYYNEKQLQLSTLMSSVYCSAKKSDTTITLSSMTQETTTRQINDLPTLSSLPDDGESDDPKKEDEDKNINVALVLGLSAGGAAFFMLMAGIFIYYRRRTGHASMAISIKAAGAGEMGTSMKRQLGSSTSTSVMIMLGLLQVSAGLMADDGKLVERPRKSLPSKANLAFYPSYSISRYVGLPKGYFATLEVTDQFYLIRIYNGDLTVERSKSFSHARSGYLSRLLDFVHNASTGGLLLLYTSYGSNDRSTRCFLVNFSPETLAETALYNLFYPYSSNVLNLSFLLRNSLSAEGPVLLMERARKRISDTITLTPVFLNNNLSFISEGASLDLACPSASIQGESLANFKNNNFLLVYSCDGKVRIHFLTRSSSQSKGVFSDEKIISSQSIQAVYPRATFNQYNYNYYYIAYKEISNQQLSLVVEFYEADTKKLLQKKVMATQTTGEINDPTLNVLSVNKLFVRWSTGHYYRNEWGQIEGFEERDYSQVLNSHAEPMSKQERLPVGRLFESFMLHEPGFCSVMYSYRGVKVIYQYRLPGIVSQVIRLRQGQTISLSGKVSIEGNIAAEVIKNTAVEFMEISSLSQSKHVTREVDSFSQNHLDAGTLILQHDDSTNPPVAVLFIDSDDFFLEPVKNTLIFDFDLNSEPRFIRNQITIQKGQRVVLTNALLSIVDPDAIDTPNQIIVTQEVKLRNGYFLLPSASEKPVAQFTLADLKAGKISFQHSGSIEPEYWLKASDGLKTSENSLVKVVRSSLPDILRHDLGEIEEYGRVQLSEEQVLISVSEEVPVEYYTFKVSGQMKHGYFSLASNIEERVQTFSLIDFQAGMVYFTSISDKPPEYALRIGDTWGFSEAVPVSASIKAADTTPVITRNQLEIVEGGNLTFSTDQLKFIDPDLEQSRNCGASILPVTADDVQVLLSNFSNIAFYRGIFPLPVTSFSWQEVLDGKIRAFHDGSETPPSYVVSVEDACNFETSLPSHAVIIFHQKNDPPIILSQESFNSVVTDQYFEHQLNSVVFDPDTNDTVTIDLRSLPVGTKFDRSARQLSGVISMAGRYVMKLVACDTVNACVEGDVILTVDDFAATTSNTDNRVDRVPSDNPSTNDTLDIGKQGDNSQFDLPMIAGISVAGLVFFALLTVLFIRHRRQASHALVAMSDAEVAMNDGSSARGIPMTAQANVILTIFMLGLLEMTRATTEVMLISDIPSKALVRAMLEFSKVPNDTNSHGFNEANYFSSYFGDKPVLVQQGQYRSGSYQVLIFERGLGLDVASPVVLDSLGGPCITGDVYQQKNCHLIEFYGQPAVTCEGRQTTVVYQETFLPPQKRITNYLTERGFNETASSVIMQPFANLNGNIMLGQVLCHWFISLVNAFSKEISTESINVNDNSTREYLCIQTAVQELAVLDNLLCCYTENLAQLKVSYADLDWSSADFVLAEFQDELASLRGKQAHVTAQAIQACTQTLRDFGDALEEEIKHAPLQLKYQQITHLVNYSMVRGAIAPDGNCLYHALGDKLGYDGATLRTLTTDYLARNFNRFEKFIPMQAQEGYISRMRSGAWGDHVALSVIHEMTNRTIVVITPKQRPVLFIGQADEAPIFIGYNGQYYNEGGHYEGLTEKSGHQSEVLLATMLSILSSENPATAKQLVNNYCDTYKRMPTEIHHNQQSWTEAFYSMFSHPWFYGTAKPVDAAIIQKTERSIAANDIYQHSDIVVPHASLFQRNAHNKSNAKQLPAAQHQAAQLAI